MNEQESINTLRADVCRNVSGFLSYEGDNTFTGQATAKELAALDQRVTAARIEAKAQQLTIDLISERLDRVIGAIVTAREEEENEK